MAFAGILSWIYLDDILFVGPSRQAVKEALKVALQDQQEAGLIVNTSKSILAPTQCLQHLGFTLDLAQGFHSVPQEKLQFVKQELKKLLPKSMITRRKLAAILGSTRAFLQAIPCLRAFTDQMLQFCSNHSHLGWDYSLTIPLELKEEVNTI